MVFWEFASSSDVHNGKPDIVKAGGPFSFDRLIDVIRDAMKFLSSDHQIKVRHLLQKRRSPTLSHASQKSVHDRAIAGRAPAAFPFSPAPFCSARSRTLHVFSKTTSASSSLRRDRSDPVP